MRIKNRLRNQLNTAFQPQMCYDYRRQDGVKLINTRVSNTAVLESKENLNLEDNVFIGHFNVIDASNHVTIREGCQITNFISILSHSSHQSIRLYGQEYRRFTNLAGYVKGAVEIGPYTFVGPHSVIMPGTTLGKGSLVAAYSYVQGDFPDFAVLAGNPAQVVGDTRQKDERFLQDHPELREFYAAWAKEEA